ncbi:MAG: undecaprenyl/decaprenyl-phosphate alpha-N-acetylglucosaminyl 1-phosphate transferase [Muribaculaceae bacterium]|nr:undecaprenyl/decaprenyl-phosphate alpha-N-acetylglucosaminyl 1-phosphate transferase [Muribaculaceae bacterium]MDE6753110.1 undecaprenyl/decaprenyl-phosphate alpha-N-acetylglucosaminyl 1-phosphate transferase [Muribaculaceae bacterium]
MINWIANDIVTFIIALGLTGIIIPQILLIAFRKKLFDDIDERKIHKGVVPRLGGIAFLPSILFSLTVVVGWDLRLGGLDAWSQFSSSIVPMYFMIGATLLMFLVGIADDLVGVRYVAKFIVQILSAILIVMSGLFVDNLYGFLWLNSLPSWFGALVTAFAVVYVVNSVNLIDGIDGLASGLSTVALVFYAVTFYLGGDYVYSMLACASAGTLFPFFYYNVFGNAVKRKKIFMGDTGALTTGMILVFCAIAVLHIDNRTFPSEYNPFVLAISPLIIPCFDVVRVYFHRVRAHRNPFLPDKCHIHHKLLALGLNQRAALCVILLWALGFIVINVSLSSLINPTLLILGDIVIWTIANVILSRSIRAREKRLNVHLFD